MKPTHIRIADAVAYYGDQVKLAKALNITPAAVTNWKAKGEYIPEGSALRLIHNYPTVAKILIAQAGNRK